MRAPARPVTREPRALFQAERSSIVASPGGVSALRSDRALRGSGMSGDASCSISIPRDGEVLTVSWAVREYHLAHRDGDTGEDGPTHRYVRTTEHTFAYRGTVEGTE